MERRGTAVTARASPLGPFHDIRQNRNAQRQDPGLSLRGSMYGGLVEGAIMQPFRDRCVRAVDMRQVRPGRLMNGSGRFLWSDAFDEQTRYCYLGLVAMKPWARKDER